MKEPGAEQRRSPWLADRMKAHREHVEAHRNHVRALRSDAAAHQQRILEVAQRLFAEQGVENVSMRQIALAAGVGQGTLYRRYAHKGELCLEILDINNERLAEEVSALLASSASESALTRLDHIFTLIMRLFESQGDLLEAVAYTFLRDMRGSPSAHVAACRAGERADTSAEDRQASPVRDQWYRWIVAVIEGLLTEAVIQGELPALDVEYTATAIMATFNPRLYRMQRRELGYSQERILQGLRRLFLIGMATPNGAAPTLPSPTGEC